MNENLNEGATAYGGAMNEGVIAYGGNFNAGATQVLSATNQPPQGAYAPPQNQAIYTPPVFKNGEMSVGDWILTLFLLSLPVVNVVLLIVWIVSSNVKYKQRSNYCKALLIYTIARWVLLGILGAIGIVTFLLITGGDIEDLLWEIDRFFYRLF